MPLDNEISSTEPTRVKNFALFFKNYMSIWSVVIAALPIPITYFKLIPVFDFQKEVLSTYTTLFCFLILGYIFYSRHRIAKFLFPDYYYEKQKEKYLSEVYSFSGNSDDENIRQRTKEIEERRKKVDYWLFIRQRRIRVMSNIIDMLPFIFIILSISSAFYYNSLIEDILTSSKATREETLKAAILPAAYSTLLMATYLAIFLFAETAFILMAIKEYLQDLLGINDNSLMLGVYSELSVASFQASTDIGSKANLSDDQNT